MLRPRAEAIPLSRPCRTGSEASPTGPGPSRGRLSERSSMTRTRSRRRRRVKLSVTSGLRDGDRRAWLVRIVSDLLLPRQGAVRPHRGQADPAPAKPGVVERPTPDVGLHYYNGRADHGDGGLVTRSWFRIEGCASGNERGPHSSSNTRGRRPGAASASKPTRLRRRTTTPPPPRSRIRRSTSESQTVRR